MKRKTRSTTRIVFLSAVVVVAVVGLTSCDGEADHYFAIFGPTSPAEPGPACGVYCVATADTYTGGDFEVRRGHKVRFVNFTKSPVDVELKYFDPGGSVTTDTFSFNQGKSKKITIGTSLAIDTKIQIVYRVSGIPGDHGGPGMIVEP